MHLCETSYFLLSQINISRQKYTYFSETKHINTASSRAYQN